MSTFFFFKQKTAYELRISDWSSDVCSSDLAGDAATRAAGDRAAVRDCRGQRRFAILDQHAHAVAVDRAGIVDRAARRQRDAGADPDDLPLRTVRDARHIGGRVLPFVGKHVDAIGLDEVLAVEDTAVEDRAAADEPYRIIILPDDGTRINDVGDRKSTRLTSSHKCAPG